MKDQPLLCVDAVIAYSSHHSRTHHHHHHRLVSGLLDRDQEVGLIAERVGGLGRYVEYTTSQLSPIESY